MLPTGGTTGASKGAAHLHASVEMEIINLKMTMDFDRQSRLLLRREARQKFWSGRWRAI